MNTAQLTEQVSFRTTPELKMHYAEKAAQLGISLSEYLTLSLKEYERLKSLPPTNQVAELPVQAAPVGGSLSEILEKAPSTETDSNNEFVAEKLDLILEMITDRLTPAAIDEVEKQNIINAAREAFTSEFQTNNLVISTDAVTPGGQEFKALFNEILNYRIQKGKCFNGLSLIVDLIEHADSAGMMMPTGSVRKAKAIMKEQKAAFGPKENELEESEL